MRRLHRHVVADAIFGIQPERRRGLEAGAQRDQKILRHILGLQPQSLNARAVNIHVQRGLVEGLLHVHVGCAGNMTQLVGKFFRDLVVASLVVSDDLYINRRRRAKIQNLA